MEGSRQRAPSPHASSAHTVLPRWPVRLLLIGLVLACLVPGLIGAALLLVHDYRNGRAKLEENYQQTTRALVQAVDMHLLKAQAIAQSFSTSDALRRRDFAGLYRHAQDLLALNALGTRVVLSDRTGQQIFNTAQRFGQPLPMHGNPEQIRRVAETGKPSISSVFTGNVSNRMQVTVDVPVFERSTVAYVVSVMIDPAILASLLKKQGLPPDWVIAVLDSSGAIVARTHAMDRFIGRKPSAALTQRITERAEDILETVTPDGMPVLSIYSRSPATGWTVALGIPRDLLEHDYNDHILLLAVGMFVLFSGALGLAWYIGEKIARSIRLLTVPAQALGAGRVVRAPRVHIREAGEVAKALTEASDLLHHRTEALRQTNEMLRTREMQLAQAHRLARFGTWYRDLATGVSSQSDSLRDIFGNETIADFPDMRAIPLTAESRERVHAATDAALETGAGYDLELQAIRADGSVLWFNAKCEAILSARGEMLGLRGSIQDITERKQAAQELLEAETRSRATFEQAAVGMARVALDGRWLQVNDRLCAIIGHDRQSLLRMTAQDITATADLTAERNLTERLLADELASYTMEKRYLRSGGAQVWTNTTVSLVRAPDGKPDYCVFVVEDIQRRKAAEAALDAERQSRERQLEQLVNQRTSALQAANLELENLARSDALTGLQNRLSANERLRAEFLRMKRTTHGYTVLLMDIDHFKRINDTFGHEAGDQVLRQVAETLSAKIRITDFVARFGGEEFLVLLPETGEEGALTIAEKIRTAVAAQDYGTAGRVTVSIGMASSCQDDHDEDDAVRRADAALYAAKGQGRDLIRSFRALDMPNTHNEP